MDMINSMILEQYDENLETFKKINEIIQKELVKICNGLSIEYSVIKGRVKERESLSEKLERKGGKYRSIFDLTDIVGTRIVTFYQSEVDKIASQVISTFDIDWDRSIDKRNLYSIDQFGYVSIHYIVRIPESLYYDENNPLINKIYSEIQIRTNLQHTWASIYHHSGYKSDIEIPKPILRQFSRLAGLLELADQEFQDLHDSLIEYRRKVSTVFKLGKYEDIELTLDSYKVYVESGGFDTINQKIASINNMEIEQVSLDLFLKVFKIFGFKTLKEVDDLVKNYSDLAYQLRVLQFANTDIDIITSATGPFALCIVYILKEGYGVNTVKQLLDLFFGERKSNLSQATRLYKLGETLGIVKEIK